jgi:cbb3-type cytochrome oxidase subunit 3
MDMNLLREAVTVLSFAGFLGIVAYALKPGNKEQFEEAARVPLGGRPAVSDFDLAFWSLFVAGATLVSIVFCALCCCDGQAALGVRSRHDRTRVGRGPGGVQQPAAAWWVWLFWITILFGRRLSRGLSRAGLVSGRLQVDRRPGSTRTEVQVAEGIRGRSTRSSPPPT